MASPDGEELKQPSNDDWPKSPLEFMEEILTRSFRVSSSKFERMMGTDALRSVVMAFLDNDEPQVLHNIQKYFSSSVMTKV